MFIVIIVFTVVIIFTVDRLVRREVKVGSEIIVKDLFEGLELRELGLKGVGFE